MFDHLGLRVRQLAPSIDFYRAALAPLGHTLRSQGDDYAGFGPAGPEGSTPLWLHAHAGDRVVGAHVAFTASSRQAVHAFHEQGLAHGGRDNGAPGPRADYGEHYYAAFLIDPDGNNVEAVCMKP